MAFATRLLATRIVLLGAFALVTSLTPAIARAQSGNVDGPSAEAAQPAAARPRIGLALGGGAGRGLAHIGVLEWFEQNRIPIDYVGGTSMGGLVAGAYAAGMTPPEIRQLMRDSDWDNIFLADSPFKYKTFRRKEDARAFNSQLKFGLKGGLTLPTGVNPGQRVLWMLNQIAGPFGTLASFDDLPTPFRCVATDLNKSEPVTLDRGNLSTAMRATMAIPGVFTPVKDGDRLYIDGGTMNNIPANVVRQMGADIVIAVDVSADVEPVPPERLTLFGVLGKTIDTMMAPGTREALKSADLILDPDLKGLTATDWRRSDALADRGFAAAKAMEAQLLKYRLDEAGWAEYLARRKARTPSRAPRIDFVRIDGVDGDAAQVIRAAAAATPGQPIDFKALENSLNYVTGSDRYETIAYRLDNEDGKTGLVLDVVPKSYAPPFLLFAFDLQNIDSTTFSANLRARAVFMDVLNAGSEVRLDVSAGSNQLIGGELFVPLGDSHLFATLGGAKLFVAPRVYFSRTQRNGYVDGDLQAEYRVKRTGGGLDIGFTSGRRSEVRLGYDVRDVRGRLRVGSPVLPEGTGTDRFASLRWTFDGQTSPLVPTRGTYVRSHLDYFEESARPTTAIDGVPVDELDDAHPFWQAEVRVSQFFRVKEADRFFIEGSGATSFGKEPVVNDFELGGPLRLGSFNRGELRGPNYLLVTTGYLKQLLRLPDFLGGSLLAGGWVEAGSAFEKLDQAQIKASITGGLVVESLLGPIFGGVSTGTNGGLRFYISLGPLFR